MSSSPTTRKVAEADFPTRWGHFRILGFEGGEDAAGKIETAVALVLGDYADATPLVRIHSQCLTGDVFGSLPCEVEPHSHSENYLKTKKEKLGHLFTTG